MQRVETWPNPPLFSMLTLVRSSLDQWDSREPLYVIIVMKWNLLSGLFISSFQRSEYGSPLSMGSQLYRILQSQIFYATTYLWRHRPDFRVFPFVSHYCSCLGFLFSLRLTHVILTLWTHFFSAPGLHSIADIAILTMAVIVRFSIFWYLYFLIFAQLTSMSGFLCLTMAQFTAFHIRLIATVRLNNNILLGHSWYSEFDDDWEFG